jgi:hypothetical protein
MPANPEPRHAARESYSYRRRLRAPELLPVLAIAVGAGLFAFYVARLLKQRTAFVDDSASRAPRIRRSGGGTG